MCIYEYARAHMSICVGMCVCYVYKCVNMYVFESISVHECEKEFVYMHVSISAREYACMYMSDCMCVYVLNM